MTVHASAFSTLPRVPVSEDICSPMSGPAFAPSPMMVKTVPSFNITLGRGAETVQSSFSVPKDAGSDFTPPSDEAELDSPDLFCAGEEDILTPAGAAPQGASQAMDRLMEEVAAACRDLDLEDSPVAATTSIQPIPSPSYPFPRMEEEEPRRDSMVAAEIAARPSIELRAPPVKPKREFSGSSAGSRSFTDDRNASLPELRAAVDAAQIRVAAELRKRRESSLVEDIRRCDRRISDLMQDRRASLPAAALAPREVAIRQPSKTTEPVKSSMLSQPIAPAQRAAPDFSSFAFKTQATLSPTQREEALDPSSHGLGIVAPRPQPQSQPSTGTLDELLGAYDPSPLAAPPAVPVEVPRMPEMMPPPSPAKGSKLSRAVIDKGPPPRKLFGSSPRASSRLGRSSERGACSARSPLAAPSPEPSPQALFSRGYSNPLGIKFDASPALVSAVPLSGPRKGSVEVIRASDDRRLSFELPPHPTKRQLDGEAMGRKEVAWEEVAGVKRYKGMERPCVEGVVRLPCGRRV